MNLVVNYVVKMISKPKNVKKALDLIKEQILRFKFGAYVVEGLKQDFVKEPASKLIDYVEKKIKKSKTKVDDELALPVLSTIKSELGL